MQTTIRNALLSSLSAQASDAIIRHLQPIDLPADYQMGRFEKPITHHYFPDVGIASIVAISPAKERSEVGLVGREGISPLPSMEGGDRQPFEFMMQVPGRGHRIEKAALQELILKNTEIAARMNRFALRLFEQVAYTSLSNAVHRIETRLARWLLMIDDRIDGSRMEVTHEFLAVMLAVRRPGVTNALHALEGHHLIHSERGMVKVRDREGLEAFAGAAYGPAERIDSLPENSGAGSFVSTAMKAG